MNIELKRSPRMTGAEDDFCIWTLIVNGYALGTFYGGKDKKYLNKEKWAAEQIKKRVPVLIRNIERLEREIDSLKRELAAINPIL